MARIDKTESSVGMQRSELGWKADAKATGELDTPVGVGIDSTGAVVLGAGNTGIVGVSVRSKTFRRAGDLAEYCSLGEIVECTGLAAGTVYYVEPDTGDITSDADDGAVSPEVPIPNIRIGYTIEADRLVIRL